MAKAGYQLRKARPGKIWMDAVLREQGGALIVAAPTNWLGAMYKAGLDRNDKVLSLEGQPVKMFADVQAVLEKHKPGDTVAIEFEQRGVRKSAPLTFLEDPQLEVVSFESLNREVTAEMKKLRSDWLGSHVNAQ